MDHHQRRGRTRQRSRSPPISLLDEPTRLPWPLSEQQQQSHEHQSSAAHAPQQSHHTALVPVAPATNNRSRSRSQTAAHRSSSGGEAPPDLSRRARSASRTRRTSTSPTRATQQPYADAQRNEAVQQAVAAVISSERDKYERLLAISQARYDRAKEENALLTNEAARLRVEMAQAAEAANETERQNAENLTLLATAADEKLDMLQKEKEEEVERLRHAQEDAVKQVLEMMERDCLERVNALQSATDELISERDRYMEEVDVERKNREEVEEACKLVVAKLVEERKGRAEEKEKWEAEKAELSKDDETSSTEDTSSDTSNEIVVRVPHRRASEAFLQDHPKEMTYSRRIALHLMRRYKFYNPRKGQGDINGRKRRGSGSNRSLGHDSVGLLGGGETSVPSLERAWAYFEHVTLPRYVVEVPQRMLWSEGHEDDDSDDMENGGKGRMTLMKAKGPKKMDRAEPGEADLPTRLYSALFTPLSQLGDFGLGVGLYFTTLRAVMLISLVAGIINLPNIMYFSGSEYSNGQPGVNALLKGTAICTEQEWVPCPTCTLDDFDDAKDRLAGTAVVDADGNLQTLVFAKRNTCDGATMNRGIINLATLGFVLLGMGILSWYQKRKVVAFDEDEQTAQDYSICVNNPPPDATDPQEWRDYFANRFDVHVTCCTVTVDNDLLVRSLVERREALRKIEMRLPDNEPLDAINLSHIAAEIENERGALARLWAKVQPGVPELFGRVVVLNAKIQGLAQQEYAATHVFATFETEQNQRKVLKKLSVGTIPAHKNKAPRLNQYDRFRGKYVLDVQEPDEPCTIRWMDLDEKFIAKVKQLLVTTTISLAMVLGVALLVRECRKSSALYAAFAISVSNSLFPMVAKTLTNMESHASESSKQTSLYLKIAVFRWVITAIVMTIITPFTSSLSNGPDHLIQSIYAIFFADMVTSNVLQLLDPIGNFRRHILAPRAKTQEHMNNLMQGTVYTLAERYTNMTKTLFLSFWYCALYPSAFFMCSLTLLLSFFVDKFSLTRTWKPAPKVGAHISKFSRKYFFTTAIAAMAIVSSYAWSGFPYDNLCGDDVTAGSDYYGVWEVTTADGLTRDVAEIVPGERSYRFCTQDLLRLNGVIAFPALPTYQPAGNEWMTEEQESLTTIYGYTSAFVLFAVCIVFVWTLVKAVRSLYRGSYKPVGDDMKINFSDVASKSTYIPQVISNEFSHPLLAANIDHIDEELFDWKDPDRPYSYYDLTRDAEELLDRKDSLKDGTLKVFSKIRHWPPEAGGEDGLLKSALRRATGRRSPVSFKDEPGMKRSVSWSKNVDYATYDTAHVMDDADSESERGFVNDPYESDRDQDDGDDGNYEVEGEGGWSNGEHGQERMYEREMPQGWQEEASADSREEVPPNRWAENNEGRPRDDNYSVEESMESGSQQWQQGPVEPGWQRLDQDIRSTNWQHAMQHEEHTEQQELV